MSLSKVQMAASAELKAAQRRLEKTQTRLKSKEAQLVKRERSLASKERQLELLQSRLESDSGCELTAAGVPRFESADALKVKKLEDALKRALASAVRSDRKAERHHQTILEQLQRIKVLERQLASAKKRRERKSLMLSDSKMGEDEAGSERKEIRHGRLQKLARRRSNDSGRMPSMDLEYGSEPLEAIAATRMKRLEDLLDRSKASADRSDRKAKKFYLQIMEKTKRIKALEQQLEESKSQITEMHKEKARETASATSCATAAVCGNVDRFWSGALKHMTSARTTRTSSSGGGDDGYDGGYLSPTAASPRCRSRSRSRSSSRTRVSSIDNDSGALRPLEALKASTESKQALDILFEEMKKTSVFVTKGKRAFDVASFMEETNFHALFMQLSADALSTRTAYMRLLASTQSYARELEGRVIDLSKLQAYIWAEESDESESLLTERKYSFDRALKRMRARHKAAAAQFEAINKSVAAFKFTRSKDASITLSEELLANNRHWHSALVGDGEEEDDDFENEELFGDELVTSIKLSPTKSAPTWPKPTVEAISMPIGSDSLAASKSVGVGMKKRLPKLRIRLERLPKASRMRAQAAGLMTPTTPLSPLSRPLAHPRIAYVLIGYCDYGTRRGMADGCEDMASFVADSWVLDAKRALSAFGIRPRLKVTTVEFGSDFAEKLPRNVREMFENFLAHLPNCTLYFGRTKGRWVVAKYCEQLLGTAVLGWKRNKSVDCKQRPISEPLSGAPRLKLSLEWKSAMSDKVYYLAYSDNTVAVGMRHIELIDAESGTMSKHSLEGERVVFLGPKRVVGVVEKRSGRFVLYDFIGGTLANEVQLDEVSSEITSLSASSDGKRLYVGDWAKSQVVEYCTATWKMTARIALSGKPQGQCSVAANGLLAQGIYRREDDTRHIEVIELQTRCVTQMIGTKHTSIGQVAFNESGTHIVSISDDKSVQVFDAVSGQMLGEPRVEHTAAVSAICWLNAEWFVTVSGDKSIRFWHVNSQEYVARIDDAHEDSITSVATLSKDFFVTGARDRSVKKWRVKWPSDTP